MKNKKEKPIKAFDRIITGLNEAIEYEKGNLPNARIRKVHFSPIREYSKEEIKGLRLQLNLTQAAFSGLLGVSQKTVEAWEAGKNKPECIARRFFEVIEEDNKKDNRIVKTLVSASDDVKEFKNTSGFVLCK